MLSKRDEAPSVKTIERYARREMERQKERYPLYGGYFKGHPVHTRCEILYRGVYASELVSRQARVRLIARADTNIIVGSPKHNRSPDI